MGENRKPKMGQRFRGVGRGVSIGARQKAWFLPGWTAETAAVFAELGQPPPFGARLRAPGKKRGFCGGAQPG